VRIILRGATASERRVATAALATTQSRAAICRCVPDRGRWPWSEWSTVMMLGWECRATGMKPETVDRHVRKEAAGRDAATSAWAEAAVRLRTAATEAVAALPAAPAHKRRALEAAIEGGDADSSAHRRALRDAGQKARKKAMGHSPRGHQKRLMARFPDLGPFVMALVLARTMVRARTRGPAHPSQHLKQPRTSPRRKRPRPPIQIRTRIRIRTQVLSCPSGRTWRRPQRGHARSAWAEEPSRGLPTISEQTRTLQCAASATRTMRRMIAPSCSSLGPEPLICLLLGGCLQHSATPPQSTIKQ
jgi:hypothetical protein